MGYKMKNDLKAVNTYGWILLLSMVLSFSACKNSLSAVEPPTDDSFIEDVTVNEIESPIPVKWSGKTILAYELQVKNYQNSGYEINRIDIKAGSNDGTVIKTYEGGEFDLIFQPFNESHIATGSVLYLWPEFNNAGEVPDTLYHKIYFQNSSGSQVVLDGIKVPIMKIKPVSIAPPVKGNNWWWSSGPSNFDMHHRRALMTFQSSAFLSQRFAVDLIRFGEDGYILDPTTPFEKITNSDMYCYGDTLYAVADGKIFNARDGLPDLPPMIMPAPNLDNADGNYVIIEIEFNNGVSQDTAYANYAHLKTGSLMVSIGQFVNKGDPIGLLGNSGNTSGPHLHFHIQKKGFGVLLSQGIPFTIDEFHLKGIVKNAAELEEGIVPWDLENFNSNCVDEMPALNYVVDF